MLKSLDYFNDFVEKYLQVVLMTMGIVMLAVNIAQVTGRYIFFYSIGWSEELSTYMYVWIIFLALHMSAKERSELSIEAFKPKDPRIQRFLTFAREVISLLTCTVLILGSIMMIRNSMKFPQKTASLGIDTVGLYYCMPISFFLILVQKVTHVLHDVEEFLAARRDESPNTGTGMRD